MQAALVSPSIAVEGRAAIVQYAMRLDDVLSCREQPLEDVGGILNHVHIQPQDPRFIVEGMEEQMVTASGQHSPSFSLEYRCTPMDAQWDPVAEILFPYVHAPECPTQHAQMALQHLECH